MNDLISAIHDLAACREHADDPQDVCVKLERVGDEYWSCSAGPSNGPHDHGATGETPEEALDQLLVSLVAAHEATDGRRDEALMAAQDCLNYEDEDSDDDDEDEDEDEDE